jgi:phosphoribosylformylglycinamidine synthase
MSAHDIMLSESQERMLAVVTIGREQEVLDVFAKWGLPAAVIGSVTSDPHVLIRKGGEVEAKVPAGFICNGCPNLDLDAAEPKNVAEARTFHASGVPESTKWGEALLSLLKSPDIASKRWVFEQYDYTVQTRTSVWPGKGDAAVLALRESTKGIAAKIDCNARAVYANPYVGGQMAMIEAARNVACTGARPVATTNCLNFGDPNDPAVFFQFRESVRGIADAAEALRSPVVSGNVSFYNETERGEVLPTPTVGVVGVIDDVSRRLQMGFPRGMGYVYLAFGYSPAAVQEGLGCSAYGRTVHAIESGSPETPDLATEKALIEFLVGVADRGLATCAHDVSEGGVAVAFAEMAIEGESGGTALIDAEEHFQRHILGPVLEQSVQHGIPPSGAAQRAILDAEFGSNPFSFSQRIDARLFGEIPGRVLVGVSSDAVQSGKMQAIWELAADLELTVHCVGTYDFSNRKVSFLTPSRLLFELSLEQLRTAYNGAIAALMAKEPA